MENDSFVMREAKTETNKLLENWGTMPMTWDFYGLLSNVMGT